MAHTDSSILSRWVLITMVSVLSGMFYLEWRAARGDLQRLSGEFLHAMRQFEQKIELGNGGTSALLAGLQRRQDDLWQLAAKHNNSEATTGQSPLPPEQPQIVQNAPEPDADLPPLPAEIIQPEGIIKELKPTEIAADPRFNPTGRPLKPTEMYKLTAAVTRGRAMVEAIESEVRANTMEAMDVLRSENAFVDYAQGEEYQKVDGVLTAAEPTGPRSIRMYYLYPERFPQIYELKKSRVKEAELALRKAISVIDEQHQRGAK